MAPSIPLCVTSVDQGHTSRGVCGVDSVYWIFFGGGQRCPPKRTSGPMGVTRDSVCVRASRSLVVVFLLLLIIIGRRGLGLVSGLGLEVLFLLLGRNFLVLLLFRGCELLPLLPRELEQVLTSRQGLE